MGMTIDNSIRILEDAQRWRKKYGIFGTEEDDVINKLIEVAKKYQKIEQIVSDFKEYQKDISCGFGGEVYMEMVSKVVEDGKD